MGLILAVLDPDPYFNAYPAQDLAEPNKCGFGSTTLRVPYFSIHTFSPLVFHFTSLILALMILELGVQFPKVMSRHLLAIQIGSSFNLTGDENQNIS